MFRLMSQTRFLVWGVAGGALLALILVVLGALGGAPPARAAGPGVVGGVVGPAAPVLTPTQDFQDVPTSSPFYPYLHNLAAAGVVGGYACQPTGPTEPCVPPANLPYYRPSNAVTRLQMTKFIDLGRRNIADAVGTSLVISTTAYTAFEAETRSGGYAGLFKCLNPTTNCYAVEGAAQAGDFAGYFYGGKGVYAESDDNSFPGVKGHAYGTTAGSYGGEFASDGWNALRVDAPPAPNGRSQAYISGTAGSLNAVDIDPGALYVNGNLNVTGSKTGYVVDVMQNADSSALEPGDVVVIVGSGPPVNGRIPVVLVKKATQANDTAIAGVVDQALYVPDPATRAAYTAQQAAVRAAETQRNQARAAVAGTDGKAVDVPMPAAPITDAQGIPHATDAPSIAAGGYANVVTLGAYPAVKADASYGAIHAGDLLTSSPHAGYAQVVTDKAAAIGAVIGKALADLPKGTGTIPIMVTLK